MTVLIGQALGKYQIVERLGRGGMADVYKGYQPGLDRYVAVKVLHAHLAEDPDFITRFRREAKSVAELRHPYIVQVFDFDVHGDDYYMVMEYIEGGKTLKQTLSDLAARGDRLPLHTALDMVAKLADALNYAHELGMVHRDIKPANVLLPTLARPVLSDFGIARIVGQTGLTSSGMMVGTPAYMSPEQGRGERGDARSDIYALGIVLYEMLTGHPPYDADTPYAVILKHINDPLVPPRQIVTTLPDAVERIVLKCLAKNADDRFASMAELRDALRAALVAAGQPAQMTVGVSAPSTTIAKAAAAPAPQAARPAAPKAAVPRRLWPIAAVAGVVVVIGAIVLLASLRPAATPQRADIATAAPATRGAPSPLPPGPSSARPPLVEEGYQLLFTGDDAGAKERIDRALASAPDDPHALVAWAVAELWRYGDGSAAAERLERAAQAIPDDPYLHYGLGLLHSRAEGFFDDEAALRELSLAIERCGDQAALCLAAHVDRASVRFWNLGDMAGGLEDMDAAIALSSEPYATAYLHAVRAEYRSAAGDAAGALEDLQIAYALTQSGDYLERAASVALAYGDPDSAVAVYEQLLADYPNDAHYLVGRGYLDWRVGDAAAARDAALYVRELDPNSLESHYLLGLALRDLGDPEAALGEFEAFAAETDSDRRYLASLPFFVTQFGHEVHLDMARALRLLGDFDGALARIDESLAIEEYWPEPYIERGQILADLGDRAGARAAYLMAYERAGERPELKATVEELLATVSEGSITIATLGPLTGGLAGWGIDLNRGVELAVDQLGGHLRDKGLSLRVASYDDQGDVETGVALAKVIVADPDILCVIGPFMSRVTIPASEIFHGAGLTMISPSATSPAVTEPGYLEVNRVVGRDDVQGAAGATFAQELGVQSVFILHNNDPAYGANVAETFRQAAQESGLTILGFQGTEEREDFSEIIQSMLAAPPDLVYFAGYYDQAGVFFAQARSQGYQGTFMGPDGLDSPELAAIAGEQLTAGGGMVYTTVSGPASFYPEAAPFVEEYVARYGAQPGPFAAQAFDAAGVCLSAIGRAFDDNGGALPDRGRVARAVRTTQDYPSITGSLSFDRRGDRTIAPYFAVRVVSSDPGRWHENRIERRLDIAPPSR